MEFKIIILDKKTTIIRICGSDYTIIYQALQESTSAEELLGIKNCIEDDFKNRPVSG